MNIIKEFQGEYRFLSNFFPSEIVIGGILFPTNEHFYQAMKTNDYKQMLVIAKAKSPGEAKKLGRIVKIRDNWEDIKEEIMWVGLWEKFNNPVLREKLIKTGNCLLIEGNYWHDNFWGRCNCELCRTKPRRLNKLGQQLMKIRVIHQAFSDFI